MPKLPAQLSPNYLAQLSPAEKARLMGGGPGIVDNIAKTIVDVLFENDPNAKEKLEKELRLTPEEFEELIREAAETAVRRHGLL